MTTLIPFPFPTKEDWKAAATQALKGADFERTLYKKSYEGLSYEGLYTQRPSQDLSIRKRSGWQICQPFRDPDIERCVNAIVHDQYAGLEAAEIDGRIVDDTLLMQTLSHTPVNIPVYLETLTPELCLSEDLPISGALIAPLGHWVQGQVTSPQHAYKTLLKLFKMQKERTKPLRYLLKVSSLDYAEAGAHAVQELSFVLASCVEAFQQLLDKGLSCDEVLSATRIEVGVGTSFFMDLAKIRALRFLLHRLASVYDCSHQPMTIHARTLQRPLSHFDIHNNYLRQTVGAAAAVLGGVDSLGTGAYNEINGIPDAEARRRARNIQLVLKNEAYFDLLLDPARGSFFVENLSCELAEAAWAAFQSIEKQGGMEMGLRSGRIQQSVQDTAEQRLLGAARRRDVMVGVNLYATPETKPTDHVLSAEPVTFPEAASGIETLSPMRPAQLYEDLRANKGWQDHQVLLVGLGPEKGVRARAEFMQGVFASVGVVPDMSPPLKSAEDLTAYIEEAKMPHTLVFCGSDEAYAQILPEVLSTLSANHPTTRWMLAGRPAELDGFKEKGLNGCFYSGCNVVKTLESLLK